MTVRRHQFIEHEILTLVLLHSDHSGYPINLPDLTNVFRERLADITDRELVDTLKRLHPKYLALRKWSDVRNAFLEYPALGTFRDDGDFFYSGDFRLMRTPETDPHVQELRELFRAQGVRGESMTDAQRRTRFERWESLGLERVKNDLMQTGGIRDVGGPPEMRELAWEWVRMKEAQTKAAPDDALLERVLGNIVNKADESWRDIGRRVLNQASATGLHGRLHLVAKEQIDPLHEAAVNQIVKSISKFAAKSDLPLSSLFQKFEPRFADLNARALRPVEEVARTVFREPNQLALLEGQLNAVKTSFEERCKRAQEEKEFEAMNEIELEGGKSETRAVSRKVFVVHGHDEVAREKIARFLERLEFQPIILHEQASRGRTVIEKVEAHSDVGFAVVLLTPDDEGCKKGGTPRPRARQNVVLELGYFLGRLGRTHVCALKRGDDLEVPSDFEGVVYVPFDNLDGWKQALGRELEAADFVVDWSKAMGARP